ncbi:MAG: VOC family protein [Bacteroidetes bacterium]|nr:VOC family protein [Bacteroidota bacterium]
MKKEIYPCFWFDAKAKEAATYYCSVFKNARITSENPMVVIFEINGQKFMCLNGGPDFKFNESVSFVVECDTQDEIDYYWNSLTKDGGSEGRCGWLKDKFGLSWQIVPAVLGKLMSNPEKSQRVMQAFMQMKKFDIKTLENA